MKITEITISIGQTKQIAQFEPRNYHVSVKVELGENEKAEEAFKIAKEKVEKEVDNYFEELKESEEPFPTKKEKKQLKIPKEMTWEEYSGQDSLIEPKKGSNDVSKNNNNNK